MDVLAVPLPKFACRDDRVRKRLSWVAACNAFGIVPAGRGHDGVGGRVSALRFFVLRVGATRAADWAGG